MKPFRFTSADFSFGSMLTNREAMDKANALLDEHLKTLPRVWHVENWKEHVLSDVWHPTGPSHPDTHSALLWGVEPIKRLDEGEQ